MAWTDPPRTWTDTEIVTQTMLNTHVRDQFKELWHEVAYVEFTATVTATNLVETAAIDIVSSGAITYVANPIVVEVVIPEVTFNTTGGVNLWDGATDLGRILFASGSGEYSGTHSRRLTPTAASHTYKARLWCGTGSGVGNARAGAGGVGVTMPGFIRVMQRGG